jgi:hypothetical protein
MGKCSSQIYSILFFLTISILTIIIVQTLYTFIKNELHFQTFIVSIIIETTFVIVIVKVYDELGCKWESLQTIPLLRKKKEFQTHVQNNYYYNRGNEVLDFKIKYCSSCGTPTNTYQTINRLEKKPKFCGNCGSMFTDDLIEGNLQKEWSFHN